MTARPIWMSVMLLALSACGGGDSDEPVSDQTPQALLQSPAEGTTFKGGDALTVAASARDAEDGNLPPSRLSWWVDFHHDTHVHPFQPLTTGTGATLTLPVRGETADNVWYRIHLQATDSAGHQVEVTRDVLPQKAQVTLATQPPGLQLTLDGQPVTAPFSFTGVVGIERDLVAPAQDHMGRHYTFSGWSDAGAATHTVSTPALATTYTAVYADAGPVNNQAPTVTLTVPASATVGSAANLSAMAGDADGQVTLLQFFDGEALLGTGTPAADTPGSYALSWTPDTAGIHRLSARATDNDGASTTSAGVSVSASPADMADSEAPALTLTSPLALATGLSGSSLLTATATDNVGVAAVEFQVDGAAVGSEVGSEGTTETTSAPYQATVDWSAYPSGQHVVRARARDAAGNHSPWASATVRVTSTASVPAGFSKTDNWITGLPSSTAFTQAPDGRLFVANQYGRVRIVKNGVLLPTSFAVLTVDPTSERGLIGIALHPDFARNGWVYVHYTSPQGGAHNRISRLVAQGDVSDGSEAVLVDLPVLSAATNHNGGALHFGLDGKMYVGVGDNANSAHSPDLSSPMGKLLRFNDDGSIPDDNPFQATQTGLARAIWAYGLRNPFTFAVQPGTGRIHINDVGQSSWEEINVGQSGANYGWPQTEGDTQAAGVAPPLFAYHHRDSTPSGSGPSGFFIGICIAGGSFYPESGPFPASYRNNYFFGDYGSGTIGRLDLREGSDNAAYAFTTLVKTPLDLLTGLDGALYVLTRDTIVRITATPSP